MDKTEFLRIVQEELAGLPEEDRKSSLEYFSEMIADRMEDGMSEQEAVASLGEPREAARQILLDTPLPALVKARMKPGHRLCAWEIVLLVLGAPLWLPLILTAGILLLVVLLVLWLIPFLCVVLMLSAAFSALACILSCVVVLFHGRLANGLLMLGFALILVGLSVFAWFILRGVFRGTLYVSKKLLRAVKSLFIGKKEDRS